MTAEDVDRDLLPPALRGPTTTITRMAAGLSGAAVYRVEAPGHELVLKIAARGEDPRDWQRGLRVQRLAAEAGLAPGIVHVDEARRAVLTTFVADRSFPRFYRDPNSHQGAVTLLGRTVRRLHALPIPPDGPSRQPQEFLAQIWAGLQPGFALPDYVVAAVTRVLADDPPASGRPLVLAHNDLNPSNLVYDGQAIVILDWATAGPLDPFYDLGVLAVFLRMDEATCLALLSAYDDQPVTTLPPGFVPTRRLAAGLAGTMQLYLAQMMKHPGATGSETPATALSLGEFYAQMMAGALELGTPEGQWAFGLALIKECLAV